MKCIAVFCLAALVVFQLTLAEEFECQEETPYKENDCNNCFCSPTKQLGCTYMLCPDVDSAKLYNCEVGTTFTKGCNKCWCVKDKGTICENKTC